MKDMFPNKYVLLCGITAIILLGLILFGVIPQLQEIHKDKSPLSCNQWCHLENCGDDTKCVAIWKQQCETKCGETHIKGELSHHENMTYAPHYVRIHIVPEKEGIKVTAIPEKEGAVLSGWTDSNSDVVFEMVSFWKYNLIVGFNFPPCQYYIIPRESEYSVRC